MNRALVIGICLVAGLVSVHPAGKWSYTGKSGPLYWHELFPQACGGKSQSPINLEPEMTVYNHELKEFAIWYDPPKPDSKMYIKNTGYTVQVDLQGDFYISNGGLRDVFKAVQFHFHWGHQSHHGSEHLIDGQASPIEMHVVSFNQDKFSDIGQAVQEPGGLAVLGVLFKLSKEDNPSFDYIIRGMRQIRNPEKVTKVELPLFSLRDLLPGNIHKYFRYQGSLTTPGCFETVTWTVFDHMQTISHKQMEEFRKLLQFKRKHHHHHHHKDENKNAGRNKRETTETILEKEHNAKQVLEELGINGKDSEFERETFKDQLRNAQAKKQHDENKVNVDIVNKVIEGTEELKEHEYVQDYIVNNFRPVQPINNRVVHRSFKLRENPEVVEYAASVQKSCQKDGDGNAASLPGVSLPLLSLSFVLITTFIKSLF